MRTIGSLLVLIVTGAALFALGWLNAGFFVGGGIALVFCALADLTGEKTDD
jgi:hypothetical protein